jgi:hypothetical protein
VLRCRLYGLKVGNFEFVEAGLMLGQLSGNHFQIVMRAVSAPAAQVGGWAAGEQFLHPLAPRCGCCCCACMCCNCCCASAWCRGTSAIDTMLPPHCAGHAASCGALHPVALAPEGVRWQPQQR